MQQYRPSSFRLLPDVIKNILIICGLAYLANVVAEAKFGFSLNDIFGLRQHGAEKFHWWQYVTHLFMHGSLMHIMFNMFAFWMFGNTLENLWGPKRFLFYFLFTGIGAAVLHNAVGYYELHALQQKATAFYNAPSADAFSVFIRENIPYQYLNPEYSTAIESLKKAWYETGESPEIMSASQQVINEYINFKLNTPTVGASGAVFGILLAFGMLFPNSIIYVYFALPVKAKYFVMLYGALELYSAMQNNPTDNVAHFAHLGGMLFGFILIKFWNKRNRSNFY